LDLAEKNEDSYLSAGEMPLPTLYLTWALIYFLAGVSWIYIIKTTKFVPDLTRLEVEASIALAF
jgi:hypothetical protein